MVRTWKQTGCHDAHMADQSIDDLTPDLLGAAASLLVSVFNAPPWNDAWTEPAARGRLDELTLTPGYVGVALHEDKRLCGFAMGHKEQWFSGKHFHLQEICVRPDRQRHGVGTALITALQARLRDVEQVYLLTARQSPASAFYERCGFRPARRQGVMLKRLRGDQDSAHTLTGSAAHTAGRDDASW
jgi:aminoglycoside 6'-N-acetyltransferase I